MTTDAALGCELCVFESSGREWVYRDEMWALRGPPENAMPGSMVLQVRRHAEGFAELTDEEASALGLLVRRVSRAYREVLGTEKVYLVAFGEKYAHVHIALMAPPHNAGPEHRSAGLLGASKQYADLAAAQEVAAAVGRILQDQRKEKRR